MIATDYIWKVRGTESQPVRVSLPNPCSIMENWNQEQPERNGLSHRLYIKGQGCGKWTGPQKVDRAESGQKTLFASESMYKSSMYFSFYDQPYILNIFALRMAHQSLWPIVEETLTSGKYISLFLISILYIYIKFKKLRDAKTGNQRKLRKWKEQMLPFCYSSSEYINCHSIQAARKKYVNNIKRTLDFYYYLPFLYGNTLSFSTYGTDGRLDRYLSLRCIY